MMLFTFLTSPDVGDSCAEVFDTGLKFPARVSSAMGGGKDFFWSESICAEAARGYVKDMDWQKMAALAVVAGTAGVFLARAWPRRRKLSFDRDSHCGCGTAGHAGGGPSVVFHARKGERARVIVRLK